MPERGPKQLNPTWPEGTVILKVPVTPENVESLRLMALRHKSNISGMVNSSIVMYRFIEDLLASGKTILQEDEQGRVSEIIFPPRAELSPEDLPEATPPQPTVAPRSIFRRLGDIFRR